MNWHTRFAPSPTGHLHLGHVAAMLFVWGWGEREGARIDVRIEDHDRQRCRPEFTDELIADLNWLGFVPVNGGVWSKQSDHFERYQQVLEGLQEQGLIYACECSRRRLEDARPTTQPNRSTSELCYPGTCRTKLLPFVPTNALRLRLPQTTVSFRDERHGELEQTPIQQCGDLVVRDRNGNWTYQFAVVVDDVFDGINWIIRGDDLLESTGRQLLLSDLVRSLDHWQEVQSTRQDTLLPTMRFRHHPLITDSAGRKLSKSDHAPALVDLREQGLSASEVIGLAAFRIGLQSEPMAIPRTALSTVVAAKGC